MSFLDINSARFDASLPLSSVESIVIQNASDHATIGVIIADAQPDADAVPFYLKPWKEIDLTQSADGSTAWFKITNSAASSLKVSYYRKKPGAVVSSGSIDTTGLATTAQLSSHENDLDLHMDAAERATLASVAAQKTAQDDHIADTSLHMDAAEKSLLVALPADKLSQETKNTGYDNHIANPDPHVNVSEKALLAGLPAANTANETRQTQQDTRLQAIEDAKTTIIRATPNADDAHYPTEKSVRDLLDALSFEGNYLGSATTFATLPAGGQNKDWAILSQIDAAYKGGIYVTDGAVFTLAKEIPDFLLLSLAKLADKGNAEAGLVSGLRLYEREQALKSAAGDFVTSSSEYAVAKPHSPEILDNLFDRKVLQFDTMAEAQAATIPPLTSLIIGKGSNIAGMWRNHSTTSALFSTTDTDAVTGHFTPVSLANTAREILPDWKPSTAYITSDEIVAIAPVGVASQTEGDAYILRPKTDLTSGAALDLPEWNRYDVLGEYALNGTTIRTVSDGGTEMLTFFKLQNGVEGNIRIIPEGITKTFMLAGVTDIAFKLNDNTSGQLTAITGGASQQFTVTGAATLTHTKEGNAHTVTVNSNKNSKEGLRGAPVANIASLKALAARNYEKRLILDTKAEYVFETGKTPTASDVADDATTGAWVLQQLFTNDLALFHSDVGASFLHLSSNFMGFDLGTPVINDGFTTAIKDGRKAIIFPEAGTFSIDASATAFVDADSAAGAWRHHIITLALYRNSTRISVIDTAEIRLDDKGSTGHLQLSGLADVQANDYLRIDAGTNNLRIDYKDRFVTIAQIASQTILRPLNPPDLSTERTGKDADNIFTVITHKRADNTVYSVSTLSGGTAPEYTTRTAVYYKEDGTTIDRTIVYALTYIAGDLISEVIV